MPDNYPTKKNIPWNILDVVLSYVFVLSVVIFTSGLLIVFGFDESAGYFAATLEVVMALTIFYTVYLILSEEYQISIKEYFGIDKKELKNHIVTGLKVFSILLISVILINIIFVQIFSMPNENPFSNYTKSEIKLISIFAILTAPFIEEFYFRGFMQPAFIKRLGVAGGIILTSLIFSLSHANYFEYNFAIVSIFAISVILGITRYKTDSIMPCFFAHLFNNIFATILIL